MGLQTPVHDGQSSPSILIVDDEPDITCALHDLLEHKGYRTDVVSTGSAAISSVQQRHFGAVLLDIGLPDIDGITVLKRVQEIDPKLPIIIITAYTKEEDTVGALSKGAFAYIIKPYNPQELLAVLRRAVGVQALAVKAERVERDLSASEERFQSVVQTANDAIILADRRGDIVFWNDAARRLFGYTYEEVAGQKRIERGEIVEAMETVRKRKDGALLDVCLTVSPLKNAGGEVFGASAIVRDITEYKRAEHELRESQERFRQLIELIHEVFLLSNPEKNEILYISPAYEEIWGGLVPVFMHRRNHGWMPSIRRTGARPNGIIDQAGSRRLLRRVSDRSP